MKKTNDKTFLRLLLTAISSLTASFITLFIPLKITSSVNADAIRIVFCVELFAMFAITAVLCISQAKKLEQRKKDEYFKKRHNQRIKEQNDFFNGLDIERIKADSLIEILNAA